MRIFFALGYSFSLLFISKIHAFVDQAENIKNCVLLVTVSDDRSGRKGGKYEETQNKIMRFFLNNPQFGISNFCMWKWNDLVKTQFYEDNKVLLNNRQPNRNGRAYKPFVISEGLKLLNDGDFLIYTDSSPEMWSMDENYELNPAVFSIDVIKKLCIQNGGILTACTSWNDTSDPRYHLALAQPFHSLEYGLHTHSNFTLDRCIRKMGLWEYRNSLQHESGTIILCKSEKTMKFAEEWLYWNLIDECASLGWANIDNDYSFWAEEASVKMGHRHDQSISGLLINKMGGNLIKKSPPPTARWASNFLQFCQVGVVYSFVDSNITKFLLESETTSESELQRGD